ncbi:MAG: carboxypeptidase regulatory-like domain-containing protein [Isosphaeraceae bacterium]
MVGLLACLALAIPGQLPTIGGTLLDASGKPAAGVELLLSAGVDRDGSIPVIARARTDASGAYRLDLPGKERLESLAAAGTLWAIGPDGSLGVGLIWPIAAPSVRIEPRWAEGRPRTVHLTERGRPIAGARVSPGVIQRFPEYIFGAIVPDELAARFESTTDADGQATLRQLGPEDLLVGLRIAPEGKPSQVLDLISEDRQARRWPPPRGRSERIDVEWPSGRPLQARIVDHEGRPAVGLEVQVWNRGDSLAGPMRVEIPGARTDADGRFRTPDGVAFPCRLLIRADRAAPILSGWLSEGQEFQAALQPLRAIEGRVVDRAGRGVAGVEVFQTGDGPIRTSARTDASGRYRLEGLGPGPALLFVKGEGFRFRGELVEGDDAEIGLTRIDEAAGPMPTLADALDPSARKALARRLLEPYLQAVLPSDEENGKTWALRSLLKIDPAEALDRLETAAFPNGDRSPDLVREEAAVAMAADDPDEAAAVVEAIANPTSRAWALIALADALPKADRERRRDWLERVILPNSAESRNRLLIQGRLAERFWEIGDEERARSLFEEGRKLAGQVADPDDDGRAFFAFHLGRIDPPAALRLIDSIRDARLKSRALRNLAIRVPPAESDAVLQRLDPNERFGAHLRLCRDLAATDPDHAERLAASGASPIERAGALLLTASAIRKADPGRADADFRRALAELDRIEDPASATRIAALMPWAEAIDPGCVGEVFWRAASQRRPSGDPRTDSNILDAELPLLLARYDRAVAAFLFGPWDRRQADKDASAPYVVETMLAIDPARAIDYVEALPPPGKLEPSEGPNWARILLSKAMALDAEARWRDIWRTFSGLGGVMDGRELW